MPIIYYLDLLDYFIVLLHLLIDCKNLWTNKLRKKLLFYFTKMIFGFLDNYARGVFAHTIQGR